MEVLDLEESLGVLEIVLGQGVELGRGLSLEHSERSTGIVHVLIIDDSKQVSVGRGFGVVAVAVAGHFNFNTMY